MNTKVFLVNLVTFLRLPATALTIYLLFNAESYFLVAGVYLFGVIGTDAVDGWLARKLNATTMFGKMADPLLDKVSVLSLFTALILRMSSLSGIGDTLLIVIVLLFGIVIGLEIKLIWIAGSAYYRIKKKKDVKVEGKMGSNVWGKTKMILQCITLTISFILVVRPSGFLGGLVVGLFALCILFAILSIRKHLLDYNEERDILVVRARKIGWFRAYEDFVSNRGLKKSVD